MASIIEDSVPAMHEESQLFSVPISYTERWRTEYERINPTTVVSDDGTNSDFSFFIPPSSNGLLDLATITLELELAVKVKTKDTDWTFITATDQVAPVNNVIHSLFQSVNVSLGNRTISDAGNTYGYRAYMESLLYHTRDNAKSVLGNAGYQIDGPGTFNLLDLNPGATWRRKLFTRGEYVQLSGKICCDLFQQKKPLITGVPVGLRFMCNKQDFYLQLFDQQSGKQYKAIIRNPRLAVRRFIPDPGYMVKVTEEMQKQTVKYAIERTIMRSVDISKGVQSTVISNLHMGALPKVVLIGFVASEDYCGKLGRSPYNFQHYEINQISVEVDGQSFPTKPYSTNFPKHQFLEAHDGLLNTLGVRHEPYGSMQFDREAYYRGFSVFGFDLTPGSTGRGPMTLIKSGTLSVSVTFARPLHEVVMMVAMLVYDNLIEINQHRQVIADFTA